MAPLWIIAMMLLTVDGAKSHLEYVKHELFICKLLKCMFN